jgi:tetratricopeptide (TPR) repeat protein
LLALASVLPYLPSLRNGFVFDDRNLIEDNPAVLSASPRAAWVQPYWPDRPGTGLYRPWSTFSYWMDARVAGVRPAVFHGVNLLLHAATTLVILLVLRRLFPARAGVAAAAAFLVAVHPLRSEAVLWAVGRSELLAAFWGMLAYLLAVIRIAQNEPGAGTTGLRSSRAAWGPALLLPASGAAFLLAILSKESAAGIWLLPLFHSLLPDSVRPELRQRDGWRRVCLVWLVPVALAFALRLRVLGGLLGMGPISIADNVLAHASPVARILCALGYQWLFVLHLLVPWGLTPDYSFAQLVPSPGWMAAGGLFAALGTALLVHSVRRRDVGRLWGIAFVLSSGLLTSNVLFPIGTVLAERLTYLPSVGAIWLMVDSMDRLRSRLLSRERDIRPPPERPAFRPTAQRVFLALFIVWGAGLATRGWVRTFDWKDDDTLFRAAAATSPRSVRVLAARAHAYAAEGRLEEAVSTGKAALAILPGFPPAAEATAASLRALGRMEEARETAEPVVEAGTQDPLLLLELANIYLNLERGEEADAIFTRAGDVLPPGDPRVLNGHASALALQSRWSEAVAAWRRAVAASPEDREVTLSWAYSLWQTGAADSAEVLYRGLVRSAPDDPACLNDLAWFLARSGRGPQEAVGLARRAFGRRADEGTADTFLEAFLADGGCARARGWVDSLRQGADSALYAPLHAKLAARCGASRIRDSAR